MPIPTVSLGTLEVSRFIIGGNPFSGFSHQTPERSAEMKAWYTDDRVVETLFQAENLGITTCILRSDTHITGILDAYWRQGGTMRWLAQVDDMGVSIEHGVRFCLEHGASACYLHGGLSDHWVAHERHDLLDTFVSAVRAGGVPVGIAGHMPEDFVWAEQHLDLDFYMVCYYNPIPRQDSPHHQHGYDEAFPPEQRAERVALIQELKRPAIHYKVLAAGRLPAREGLAFAAAHMRPGDAVCLGIYTADKPGMLREDRDVLLEAWGSTPA